MKLEEFLESAEDYQYNIDFPTLSKFYVSKYPCLNILPDLINAGLDYSLDASSDITSIFKKAEMRYELGSFHAAVEYAKAIEAGEVDYNNFRYHPKDNGQLPDEPTLYYLAQIQPINIDIMAEVLDIERHKLLRIKRRFPSNVRLQQLYFFKHVLESNDYLPWADIDMAYRASAATGHHVNHPCIEVIIVDNSWGDDILRLESQIEDQFQSISKQPQEYKKHSDLHHLHFNPEKSQVFSAALGIMPKHLEKQGDLSITDHRLFSKAYNQIPSLSSLHIAVAAHVSGQLEELSEYPEFQWYLDKYQDIAVVPVTQRTNYLEVLQRVSALLSQIKTAQDVSKAL
ncbi:hypothetical protein E1189_11390 [Sansalvadorimonas verongulae]|nr:hypothetical protein [Sansalvadorimonas verongulae]